MSNEARTVQLFIKSMALEGKDFEWKLGTKPSRCIWLLLQLLFAKIWVKNNFVRGKTYFFYASQSLFISGSGYDAVKEMGLCCK